MPELHPSPSSSDPARKTKLEKFQLVIGLLLSIVTGYSAWKLNEADTSLKLAERSFRERDATRKDSEEVRVNRESLEKKQLQIYEAVVSSLESGNTKRQAVSKALVTSMLEDPLRTELLSVLATSDSPEIRRDAQVTLTQESKFKAEQGETLQVARKEAGSWENWDFDIFWCERSGEPAKQQAERIKKQLESDGAKGRLRVRLLPDSINARPGYQHSGYVIRFNAGEETVATRLKNLGDNIIGPKSSFILSNSSQATPWYLSAFACPSPP
jgi:hypothetical protein